MAYATHPYNKLLFFIAKVDEEGAEAAAATVVLFCTRSTHSRPPESVPFAWPLNSVDAGIFRSGQLFTF